MIIRAKSLFSPTKTIIAFLLAGGWLAATEIIGHTIGFHSTPEFFTGFLGLPGLAAAAWVENAISWIHGTDELAATSSDAALYVVGFAVNFLFYLLLTAAAVGLFRTFSKRLRAK